jgi:hypothetical protein
MWTEDRPVFAGKHYRIDAPINQPRRKPSFWIGGGGEKVTLKLVAKYADGCNVGNGDAALIEQKLAVLREHCRQAGRDYAAIAKSTTIEVDPSWSTDHVRVPGGPGRGGGLRLHLLHPAPGLRPRAAAPPRRRPDPRILLMAT